MERGITSPEHLGISGGSNGGLLVGAVITQRPELFQAVICGYPLLDYPEIFFWTNTRDDRVHPGHPRKMVARMQEQGHPVLYYENTEGGHSAGANLRQAATTSALTTVYLLQHLKDD